MTADVRMAEVAALVGDPARANILEALMGGRALTAGELVHATGVSPQTTSGHLGKLVEGRLIACLKQGRHRYYRIATPRVAEMLEGIMAVVADAPPRHRPPSRLDDAMRIARTCYDHFAGKLGVGLTDALCDRGHLALAEDGGEVTERGVAFLREFGVDLAAARRRRRISAAASAPGWRSAASISAGSRACARAARSSSRRRVGAASARFSGYRCTFDFSPRP